MITAVNFDTNKNQPVSYSLQVDENIYYDAQPVEYKVLIPYIPHVEPVFDSRYYSGINKIEKYVNTPHPVYPLYSQWEVTYELIPTSIADRIKAVDNALRVANNQLIDLDLQAQAFGEIMKKVAGAECDESILLAWTTISNKIGLNVANANSIKLAISNEQQPNIGEGWVIS